VDVVPIVAERVNVLFFFLMTPEEDKAYDNPFFSFFSERISYRFGPPFLLGYSFVSASSLLTSLFSELIIGLLSGAFHQTGRPPSD